jgi:hypothetical protein
MDPHEIPIQEVISYSAYASVQKKKLVFFEVLTIPPRSKFREMATQSKSLMDILQQIEDEGAIIKEKKLFSAILQDKVQLFLRTRRGEERRGEERRGEETRGEEGRGEERRGEERREDKGRSGSD